MVPVRLLFYSCTTRSDRMSPTLAGGGGTEGGMWRCCLWLHAMPSQAQWPAPDGLESFPRKLPDHTSYRICFSNTKFAWCPQGFIQIKMVFLLVDSDRISPLLHICCSHGARLVDHDSSPTIHDFENQDEVPSDRVIMLFCNRQSRII